MSFYLINHLLMLLVFVLVMGDVVTTNGALSKPGTREGNPIWRIVMGWIGSKWIIPRILWGMGNIYLVVAYPEKVGTWLGTFSFGLNILITSYAVISNWIKWKRN